MSAFSFVRVIFVLLVCYKLVYTFIFALFREKRQ